MAAARLPFPFAAGVLAAFVDSNCGASSGAAEAELLVCLAAMGSSKSNSRFKNVRWSVDCFEGALRTKRDHEQRRIRIERDRGSGHLRLLRWHRRRSLCDLHQAGGCDVPLGRRGVIVPKGDLESHASTRCLTPMRARFGATWLTTSSHRATPMLRTKRWRPPRTEAGPRRGSVRRRSTSPRPRRRGQPTSAGSSAGVCDHGRGGPPRGRKRKGSLSVDPSLFSDPGLLEGC